MQPNAYPGCSVRPRRVTSWSARGPSSAIGRSAPGRARRRRERAPRHEEGETTAVLHVRRARQDDASEVAGVHVRSWQVGYRGLLPDEYLDGLRAEDRMHRYTFGSTRSDRPDDHGGRRGRASSVGLSLPEPTRDPDDAGRGEVLALYVDPEAWGTGVGRRLMAEARRRLARGGATEAVLWVLAGNDRAQRFYARRRLGGRRRPSERRGVERGRRRDPLPAPASLITKKRGVGSRARRPPCRRAAICGARRRCRRWRG